MDSILPHTGGVSTEPGTLQFAAVLVLLSGTEHNADATRFLQHLSEGGSVYGYERLEHQVGDADAVIVGTIEDIVPSYTIVPPDEDLGALPMEFGNLRINVSAVIAGQSHGINTDSVLNVEILKGDGVSWDDLRAANPKGARSVHFLFMGATVLARNGQDVSHGLGVWVHQNDGSIAIESPDGSAVTRGISQVLSSQALADFETLIAEAKKAAESTADR